MVPYLWKSVKNWGPRSYLKIHSKYFVENENFVETDVMKKFRTNLWIAENQFQTDLQITENQFQTVSWITKNCWESISDWLTNHQESLRINFRLIHESLRITENQFQTDLWITKNCRESLRIAKNHIKIRSYLFNGLRPNDTDAWISLYL